MKTIEERAKKYADNRWMAEGLFFASKDGYIKGATEQIEIDIEKACEWMRKQEGWDALNDKPCQMFSEEDINNFKQEMKGETE